jgi:hypothetical protein
MPTPSWRAKVRHPRLCGGVTGKSWMPTFVGMTGEIGPSLQFDSVVSG